MPSVGAAHFWMNDPAPVEPLRLRRIPMLAIAVSFAAGECLPHVFRSAAMLLVCLLLLLVIAGLALRLAPRTAIIPSLTFMVAIGCWCAQLQPPVPQQTSLRAYADGVGRILRGRVVRVRNLSAQQAAPEVQQLPPWQIEPGGWETESVAPRQSVDLDVTEIEYLTPDISRMVPMSGGVRVLLIGEPLPLQCGDRIELSLRLRTPETYRDPGAFSYADELLTEGIGVESTAKSATVRTLNHSPAALRCQIFAAQHWAALRIDAMVQSQAKSGLPLALRLTQEDAAMLNAMLFGDRSLLSQPLREGFQRTGTFHLFVVSGIHVALLAAGLFWLLRRLRLPEYIAVPITVLAAFGYTVLTGFGVPAQRALLMVSLYLLARRLDREITALNGLGFAALVVLAIDPRSLFEASFQMTFLVIMAIAGLASPLIARWLSPHARALHSLNIAAIDAFLHPRLAQFRVYLRMTRDLAGSLIHPAIADLPVWLLRLLFYAAEAFVVAFAAEICMALPMAVYFHRATLLALPLNLLNIPLLALLLCSAVTTLCASLLSTSLAVVPAAVTAALLHAMRFAVTHLQNTALADIRLPAPTVFGLVLGILLLAAGCILLRMRHTAFVTAGLLLAVCIPLAALFPTPPSLHSGELEVTALDVGQGDSLLVVSPNGHTMLVDAGGPVGRAGPVSGWDVGEQVVAPYLWSRRIRQLDIVVLTHAHSDHMGGMSAVLRDFRPRELWLSVEPATSPGLVALLAEAHELGITVRHFHAGDSFLWNTMRASVLAPELVYSNPGAPVNDDSLVLRLDFERASVLLEGDAELRSEDTMLNQGRLAPVTLLKIGHHGSRTSTNPEFLAAVTPQEAIVSVGRHNTFGHPRGEVLARLETAHVKTYRTDRDGAETFLLKPNGEIGAFSADPQW